MSPEQIEGKPLDTRSDIFSFGVVWYEMLSAGVHLKAKAPPVATTSFFPWSLTNGHSSRRLVRPREPDNVFRQYDGGHANLVTRPDLIREILDWLDRYLGPVEQPPQ